MAGDNEKSAQEVMEAVDKLRNTVEKHGINSPEFKQIEENVGKILENEEKKHTAYTAQIVEAEKKTLEVEDRLKVMELEMVRSAEAKNVDHKDTIEYKALNNFAKYGAILADEDGKGVSAEELKTLRMDDGTSGGYLTTTEMDSQIIKTITEISPVRQVARVKSTSKKTLEIPKRTGIPTATYEGEAAEGDESQSAYGNEQLTAYRLTTTIPFTLDLLGDSEFNLESEINADVAEAFAFKEGNKFVLGTGAKQPEGFLVNAEIVAGARLTAGSGTISGDDLLLLTGDLKIGYNPMYGFNRTTLAFLRTLKGSDGQYLWQASLAPNVPNTIGGEPYMVFQDMPSIATGALSVIYGDFLRGYCITDRTGMVIVRDEYTQKKKAIVEITFHKWNTGQVVLSEAFKALQIKA
jgi:HK97 family phage major capsid protein